MPVVTRSMKTITTDNYDIAKIICDINNAYSGSLSKNRSDDDSDYVPSDNEEEEYVPPTRSRKITLNKTDSDDDSDYVPSDNEDDTLNDCTNETDEEYVPDPEDYAEDVIREGCSNISRGFPLDREFFRVCKKVVRGDYSPTFTQWALRIQPVRTVGGY